NNSSLNLGIRMLTKVIISSILVLLWLIAGMVAYFIANNTMVIVTSVTVGFTTIVSLYFIWRPKKDESSPSPTKLGITAISSVITLSTGPIWTKILATYSPSLGTIGLAPPDISEFTRDFLAISMAGLLSVVVIVGLVM